jgi:hypothetical protein
MSCHDNVSDKGALDLIAHPSGRQPWQQRIGLYPNFRVDVGGALAAWLRPHAAHDPAKVVLDLAVTPAPSIATRS